MKKNLFLLLALLCSVTFFTACGDDEDTSWQQIPKEEIKGENATLTVNGETVANGAVKFETKSVEQAVVTLSNVIIAYPQVAVDVTMEKQADGSFNFSGEKGMTTVPGTRATAAQPIIATVKVTGNVTLDGKVKVEASTVVTDPNGWAKTYGLGEYTVGKMGKKDAVVAGALYANWGVSESSVLGIEASIRGIGSALLPQMIKNITFEADGNVRAQYATGNAINQDLIMGIVMGMIPNADAINALIPTTGWQTSPKNYAYWYEKDGKMYVKLNVSVIVAQLLGADAEGLSGIISQVLNGTPAQIKDLLKTLNVDLSTVSDETFTVLLDCVKNGFPMTVKTAEGHTYLCLDDAILNPLLKFDADKDSDIMRIWMALADSGIIPPDISQAGILITFMCAAYNLSEDFNLGLDLKAAN